MSITTTRIPVFLMRGSPPGRRAGRLKSAIIFVIAVLALFSGCARQPDTGKTLLKSRTFSDLRGQLVGHKPDLDQFRLRGPFEVAVQENYEIRLSTTELVTTDLYLSAHAERRHACFFRDFKCKRDDVAQDDVYPVFSAPLRLIVKHPPVSVSNLAVCIKGFLHIHRSGVGLNAPAIKSRRFIDKRA
jgi:hypothetical protein